MDENDPVRGLLAWSVEAGHRSVISGFAPVLDQIPRNPDGMSMPLTPEQWQQTFAAGDTFERVTFPKAPAPGASWTRVAVAQFLEVQGPPETDLPKCGADLETLSKLFDDSGAATGPGGE
jgi:hypothetical protein